MNIMKKVYGIKKGPSAEITSDTSPDVQEHTAKVPKSIYLDDLTIQAVLIGVCYLLTYLLLLGLEALIGKGSTLVKLFWGFQFLFGTIIAIGVRGISNVLRKRNIIRVDYADNYLLQRISSAAFDIMIVASICAISLGVLQKYIVPVIILSTVGGLFTMFYSAKMAKWLYREERFEHAVGLYGMWTGTIVTSMALLKEIDPEGKSNVPESLVLGSGFGAIIGIPLMMVIAIPISAWVDDKPLLYVLTYAIFAVYAIACITGIIISKRLHAKRRAKTEAQ
jgi:ESS family glutamate:Na+ symporter